jgi:hypothetical protein
MVVLALSISIGATGHATAQVEPSQPTAPTRSVESGAEGARGEAHPARRTSIDPEVLALRRRDEMRWRARQQRGASQGAGIGLIVVGGAGLAGGLGLVLAGVIESAAHSAGCATTTVVSTVLTMHATTCEPASFDGLLIGGGVALTVGALVLTIGIVVLISGHQPPAVDPRRVFRERPRWSLLPIVAPAGDGAGLILTGSF